MSEPVQIAAIDAGSNAVRLSVARAYSALDIEPMNSERYSLRLGENIFFRPSFSEEIFHRAAKAFKHFHEVMEEFGVTRYRAVATSATREAQNRQAFVRFIKQKSGSPWRSSERRRSRVWEEKRCWRRLDQRRRRDASPTWAEGAWRSPFCGTTPSNKARSFPSAPCA